MSDTVAAQHAPKPLRCGKVFRVPTGRTAQMQPGDYPCTQPAGHDKPTHKAGQTVSGTPHTSVIAWREVE